MSRVPSPAPSVRPSSVASTASPSRIAGRWVAVLSTLLLGLTLGVLGATPAAAHDTLEGSNPADGGTVATVPASVSLTFNEEVQDFSPVIQVTGPDGTDWADGDPTVAGVDVTVPVKAGAPAGAYTVAYRIVSSDGHPVTGELTFTAEAGAAGATPIPASSAPASSAVSSSSSVTSSSSSPSSSTAPTSSAAATSAAASVAPSSALVSPAANASDSGSGISGWLIAIIVLVVAAGGAVVAVLVRRARGGSPTT